jgi:hypothetical protein
MALKVSAKGRSQIIRCLFKKTPFKKVLFKESTL